MVLISKPVVDPISGRRIVDDATCTRCCCVCDDIRLEVDGERLVEARHACDLGRAWFLQQDEPPRPICTVDGREASLDEGVDRAAHLLVDANYPLIFGLTELTSEAQRLAVSIADWIGGLVDTPTSLRYGPIGTAFQGVGEVTSTLGEIRHRGDLVLFWGADPAEHQPRHFERYSLTAAGQFLPGGRADRYAVLVDVKRTKTAEAVDEFIQLRPGCDFEALWALRALAKGLEPDPDAILEATGVPLAVWRALFERMRAARFGVFLYGSGLTTTPGRHLNTDALLALTRDMNAHTRFVAKAMRGRGNPVGADNVVNWRTGFPFGVSLSRGYPRFNPGEYTADDVLARREADAALVVSGGALSDLRPAARDQLKKIPLVTIDPQSLPATSGAAVAFCTATYGVYSPGTVYRQDDVPLPLRPALDSKYPSDQEVLARIERRILELKGQPATAAVPQHAAP